MTLICGSYHCRHDMTLCSKLYFTRIDGKFFFTETIVYGQDTPNVFILLPVRKQESKKVLGKNGELNDAFKLHAL